MRVLCVFLCYVILAVSTQTSGGPKHGKAVVCYITTWNLYGPGTGDFVLEDLEPSLCTHIVYGFAGLNDTTNTIKSLGPWEDIETDHGKGSYKKVVALKDRYPHLKITLAIGGGNEGSIKYSNMAANPESRAVFITSVLAMLKKFNFDGLDLVWKYPTERGGKPKDKENLIELVKELSEAFKPNKYLLTASLGPHKSTIDNAYKLAQLSRYLDFIHVMTYDYHGTWEGVLGVNAPLRGTSPEDDLSVEYTVNYMLSNGASPHKLVLGVPMYGRAFILSNPYTKELGLGSTLVDKSGFKGPFDGEPGFIGYNEICMETNNRLSPWSFEWNSQTYTPFLRADQGKVVSYDNGRSIAMKVKMAMDKGLGGIMVWSITTDDVRGNCNETNVFIDFVEHYHQIRNDPLLEKAMKNLNLPNDNQISSNEAHYILKNSNLDLHLPQLKYTNYTLTRTINDAISLSLEEKRIVKEMRNIDKEKEKLTDAENGVTTFNGPKHGKVVVCYYVQWAVYRPGAGKFTLENLDPTICTHIIYAFAVLNDNTNTIQSFGYVPDVETETGKASYQKLIGLKQKYPHLKITLAVGGWNDGTAKYSKMAANPEYRATFITSVLLMLDKFKFDGLDIVWKYPTERDGKPYDKENFVLLVKELSEAFKPHGYILSAALGAKKNTMEGAYDLAQLSHYLDLILIMGYDYHGTWDQVVGANSPLKGIDASDVWNLEYTVDYMLSHGVSPFKLVLGLPTSGRTFILTNPNTTVIEFGSTPAQVTGFQGPFTTEPGFISYNEICMELRNQTTNWEYHWHKQTVTPYIRDKERVIVYENGRSVALRAKMAVDKGLGGLMLWSIDTDDFIGNCNETDAFIDFADRYQVIMKDPLLKKAVKNLSFLDVNQALSKGAHYLIKDNNLELRLPETNYSNYPLTRTLNDAISLALEEKRIVNELKKLTEENEIPPDDNVQVSGPKHGKRVVCYIAASSTNLPTETALCTHLVYSFANLDETSNISLDYWQYFETDYGKISYKKINALKQKYPLLKVSLAIGGWNEEFPKYNISDPEFRATFITNVLLMLNYYGFDGLDLVWNYPTQRDDYPENRDNFIQLVKELSEKFQPNKYILSAALEAGKSIMAWSSDDLHKLGRYLDLINIMGFDYHGSWDQVVGPNAPLKGSSPDDILSVEFTADYMLSQGVPPYKMILGLPMHGRTFIIKKPDTEVLEFGSTPVEETGFQGSFNNGFMKYNEICLETSKDTSRWVYHWHDQTSTPYLRDGKRVITYDNGRSIVNKVKMAINKGLGGVMVWNLEANDFKANCNESDAFIDFTKRYEKMMDDPLLKKAVKNLDLSDVNEVPTNSEHYVLKNNNLHLRLPESIKSLNYTLIQTINDAISLALEEKIIEEEMAEIAKDNMIDTYKNNGGSKLNGSFVCWFLCVMCYLCFKNNKVIRF